MTVPFFQNLSLPENQNPISVRPSIQCADAIPLHHNSKARLILSTRTQILIYLALFAIIDAVIPIPVTAMILIMVLFQKPAWFKDWVEEIYR